jgi:NADPH:quinone reductase-like Zn-dependent oxidoreductase
MRPIIDEVFSFARANEALAKLESGFHCGKIVIRMLFFYVINLLTFF